MQPPPWDNTGTATTRPVPMLRSFRQFAASCLVLAGFALPAQATSYSVDHTDLWFNPAEQGWGLNLIQQQETLFATLFVYGADGSARWFVASDLRGGANNSFTGQLFRTTGPAFSAPWVGTSTPTAVGNMTITFSGVNSGTLTYTVDGVEINKQVQRQTWRANDIAGIYEGGWSGVASNCRTSTDNGPFRVIGLLTTATGSPNHTFRIDFTLNTGQVATCTFAGPYTQAGRLGSISGNFGCNTGSAGSFTISEIDVTRNGITARFNGNDTFCTLGGFVGGVRRAQ